LPEQRKAAKEEVMLPSSGSVLRVGAVFAKQVL
jgi:hypothetical protein